VGLPDYRVRAEGEAALWYCLVTQHRAKHRHKHTSRRDHESTQPDSQLAMGPDNRDVSAYRYAQKPEDQQIMTDSWTQIASAWGTIVLGVVGLASVVISIFTLGVTRESLHLAQGAFLQIAPQAINLNTIFGGDSKKGAIVIVIINQGATPARLVTGTINWCADNRRSLPADFSYPTYERQFPTILIPAKSSIQMVRRLPMNLLIDTLNAKGFIHIWGKMQYEDIFKNPHAIEYSYDFSGTIGERTGFFGQSSTHNCIDSDCSSSYGTSAECPNHSSDAEHFAYFQEQNNK
jgi:hypothetical protein